METIDVTTFEYFFDADNRIKKLLFASVPPSNEEYLDDASLSKYSNELNDSLLYIFSELKKIVSKIFNDNSIMLQKVNEFEKEVMSQFYACGLNISKLRNFYNKYVTNMEASFINEVKENCVGYLFFRRIPIDKVTSINELLHLIHSYFINNEIYLQSVPVIDEKQNDYKYPIRFRGNETNRFRELFEKFPNDLDVGWTDIISINDKKSLMMVRDRGHALTIEITINNDIARIDYFIPKICNVKMVNDLPGVNKVNNDSVGTTGVLQCNTNDLNNILFNFISRVPTDSDRENSYYKTR